MDNSREGKRAPLDFSQSGKKQAAHPYEWGICKGTWYDQFQDKKISEKTGLRKGALQGSLLKVEDKVLVQMGGLKDYPYPQTKFEGICAGSASG